jgi:hypothetical protein
VTIGGGASAVGNAQGYNNEALATRRRDNFIDYLKRIDAISISPTFVSIIAGGTKVGKATVQNSPEAQKEQYVSAAISTQTTVPVTGVEGDNTNVSNPNYDGRGPKEFDPTITPIKKGKIKRVCIKIPESLVDEFKVKVREFKKEQGLSDIPFGVYDIKK